MTGDRITTHGDRFTIWLHSLSARAAAHERGLSWLSPGGSGARNYCDARAGVLGGPGSWERRQRKEEIGVLSPPSHCVLSLFARVFHASSHFLNAMTARKVREKELFQAQLARKGLKSQTNKKKSTQLIRNLWWQIFIYSNKVGLRCNRMWVWRCLCRSLLLPGAH